MKFKILMIIYTISAYIDYIRGLWNMKRYERYVKRVRQMLEEDNN